MALFLVKSAVRIWPKALLARLLLGAALAVLPAGSLQADQIPLRGYLTGLIESHGVRVQGLSKVGEESLAVPAGDPAPQLFRILNNYNFLAQYDEQGKLIALTVLGRKTPLAEQSKLYRIPAERQGPHFRVAAQLTGSDARSLQLDLLLDTGASTVVLPLSYAARLGFDTKTLIDGWSETANGRVATKRGTLRRLQVGTAVAENVAVSFIDDGALGGKNLLGMSFLGRFRLTLDDRRNEVTLMSR